MRGSIVVCVAVVLVCAPACTTARNADRRPLDPVVTTAPPAGLAPIAPPPAPGLNGNAGLDGPNACTAIAGPILTTTLGAKVTARPKSWNDGGLPSLDLCALLVGKDEIRIGVSALTAQPNSLDRLGTVLGSAPKPFTSLTPDARSGRLGVAFTAFGRAVRISAAGGLSPQRQLAIGRAVLDAVPAVARPARITDAACAPAGSSADQVLGVSAQLRRDYRTESGAVTCIWGSVDATVAIVESTRPDDIPEARRQPPPERVPILDGGYYLRSENELVFRGGRRVVRVSALADPWRQVSRDRLYDTVGPILPLFIR
ncbi:hypothetical protein OG394_05865 [Kribbella sp. NBC_01245]|uniref:hypothetical protein n=1 Tax=Kribbella sp. NBC_01245 TaxID=2903578 RepID=UPI002E2939FB|nr:hypothetical protein [Kribbella sp. NBC_01245]